MSACQRTCDFQLSGDATVWAGTEQELLRPYVAFHAALRLAFASFLGDIQEQCRTMLRHHLEVRFTSATL